MPVPVPVIAASRGAALISFAPGRDLLLLRWVAIVIAVAHRTDLGLEEQFPITFGAMAILFGIVAITNGRFAQTHRYRWFRPPESGA